MGFQLDLGAGSKEERLPRGAWVQNISLRSFASTRHLAEKNLNKWDELWILCYFQKSTLQSWEMKCAGLLGNPSSGCGRSGGHCNTASIWERSQKRDKKAEKCIFPKVLIQEGRPKMRINNWAPVSRGGSLTGRILISKRKRWRIVRARGRSNPSGPLISISKTKLSTMSSFPLCRYRSLFAFRCSRVKTRLKMGRRHFLATS